MYFKALLPSCALPLEALGLMRLIKPLTFCMRQLPSARGDPRTQPWPQAAFAEECCLLSCHFCIMFKPVWVEKKSKKGSRSFKFKCLVNCELSD